MNTRFRILAALLAFLAFSASLAEQAWAGACAPVAAEASAGAGDPHAHGGHGGIPASEHSGRDSAPATDDGCPVQAVAAGCTLIVLPAPAGMAVAPAPAPSLAIPANADASRGRLFVSPSFRPPRR